MTIRIRRIKSIHNTLIQFLTDPERSRSNLFTMLHRPR